jgi:hypothetical protein
MDATELVELTDAEVDLVGAGSGFGLTTAVAAGASPPAATSLQPPGTEFGPGYGMQTAFSTGNFPAFRPPHP